MDDSANAPPPGSKHPSSHDIFHCAFPLPPNLRRFEPVEVPALLARLSGLPTVVVGGWREAEGAVGVVHVGGTVREEEELGVADGAAGEGALAANFPPARAASWATATLALLLPVGGPSPGNPNVESNATVQDGSKVGDRILRSPLRAR
jgi:hypothetical protein